MISVEEWRLKMTENVKLTFERLTGSSRKASESFTRTQDKLDQGTRNMGRTAERVQQQLGQTGGALNRLFGRFRFQANELFGGMKQGWREALDEKGLKGFGDVFRRMNPLRSLRSGFGNLFGGMRQGVQEALGDGVKKAGKGGTSAIRKQRAEAIYKGLEMGGSRGIPPLLGSIARVTGPLAIATMGYMVAAKAYGAAKAYDPSARELRLANLGKTPAEQTALRDQVLGMAGGNGFNAQEATSAFIAVQRTSGASTTAVNAYVSTVGQAAGALNQDFMPTVAGSAKVLKDFGLPLERATDLLDSNVKAMAAGKVTYDMLAKAQADFAIGARLANQRLDTANSLYAAFAANGNDASQAGDRLTSAMEGLRHTNTIKAFKAIGVNVLDAQGQMRQMDDVVRELVPHLAGMNNARFDALKQQFAGNEGMVELLDLARGNSEKLLGTLDQFKNSKLGISEQLEAAKNDLDLTAKQIEERMNTAWINIGNSMRPMFQQFQKFMLWIAEGFVGMADPVTMNAQRGIRASQEYAAAQKERVDKLAAPASTGTAEERQRGMADLYRERTKLQYAYDVSVKNGIDSNAKRFKEQLLENRMAITSANAAWGKMAKPNGTGPETPGTTSLITDKGGNDPLKQGATAIVGGGKQVRNVNVTIQKLVEKLEVRTAGTVREGISNVRQQVEQALVDIVRGGEAALANG